jgi:hypothetical protein
MSVWLNLLWPVPFFVLLVAFKISINYKIEADRLIIKVSRFNWMILPFSAIEKIEPCEWIVSRDFRVLQLSNMMYFKNRYKLTKTGGTYRFVLINPKEPKVILDAFAAYLARNPRPTAG